MRYGSFESLAMDMLEHGWKIEPNAFTKNEYEISFFDDYGEKVENGDEIIFSRYGEKIKLPLEDLDIDLSIGKISIFMEG